MQSSLFWDVTATSIGS